MPRLARAGARGLAVALAAAFVFSLAPADVPTAAAATASVRLTQPLSNQSYPGTALQVQVDGEGLQSAAYRVDAGGWVAMIYDVSIQRWAAGLDISRMAPGSHDVDVMGTGTNGAVVSDRVWNVLFPGLARTPTAIPTLPPPTPTAIRTPTPAPTAIHPTFQSGAAAPLSISIRSPLTSHSYSGLTLVTAVAASAVTATYQVDAGQPMPMLQDLASGVWQAGLDTKTLANGSHTVIVTATGSAGASQQDRASNIRISNPSAVSSPSVSNASPPSSSGTYLFGLIGDDTSGTTLATEYDAGVRAKIISLSWKDYLPTEGVADAGYVTAKRTELARLRSAGFEVIADLGLQDTPAWLHANYPDSSYVDQFGDVYGGAGQSDQGDANLVFNSAVRDSAARYVALVFNDLGTGFKAVRLGGGRSGELSYPPATYNGHPNAYWASDVNASRANPTPHWQPGQVQTSGEAQSFADWYLDALVDYQNWQIATVRKAYSGSLMMLYPGWGIRPGQLDEAVAANLSPTSSGALDDAISRGLDFARQVAALQDAGVIVTTTWLDADPSQDGSPDARYWSPVKYLSRLAGTQVLHLATFGENGGQGSPSAMRLAANQMRSFGLLGMAWYTEGEVLDGQYATLADFTQATGSA